MADLTLVLGGIRSGKSRFAEELAAAQPPVVYLATALPGDEEMRRRIEQHRRRRPRDWQTVECPWNLAAALARHQDAGSIVVECVTLWLTNLMLGIPGHLPLSDPDIVAMLGAGIDAARNVRGRVIFVSNEVGSGGIAMEGLARRFGDLLGEVNQRLAAAASAVHLCVAGLPVRIK